MPDIKDFKVGDCASITHQITAEDVRRFVELTGDDNPLHVDPDFAEESPMRGVVAHGMLSASFLSTVIGKHLPGPGALWVSQSVDFLAPVRLNDVLDVRAEVTEVHVGRRTLKLVAEIRNQRGKKVLAGECLVKVLAQAQKKLDTSRDQSPGAVIVTGASRGIGAAIARKLASSQIPVIINFRKDREGAQRTVTKIREAGGKAWEICADVTSRAQVAAMVEEAGNRAGGLIGLVNNASPPIIEESLEKLSWGQCLAQFEGQVGGALNCIQAALPFLEASSAGSIVNIGSIVVDQNPPPDWIAYNLAKASIHALTRNLAEVLGPKGIRINTVAPGMTDTSFIAEVPERVLLLTKMQTPLRSIASPEDIAGVVSFLLGPEARHITGETVRVNGGKAIL